MRRGLGTDGTVMGCSVRHAVCETLDDDGQVVLAGEHNRLTIEGCDSAVQSLFSAGLSLDHCRMLVREGPHASDVHLREAVAGLNQAIDAIRTYAQRLAVSAEHRR